MNISFSLNEIHQAAATVYEVGKNDTVWAIHGEMGAGKTTFIHALCENLGVTSAIGSPTYAIINEYKGSANNIFNPKDLANPKPKTQNPGSITIYHMDWYRLKDEEEALQAGVEDCILSGHLCLIEWPEIAKGLLPDNCFHIHIHFINPGQRSITTINSLG